MPYAGKKKSAKLDKSYPHIGEIVRGIMKDQRVTQRKLGKTIGWHNTTINQMLKRRTWDIAELLEVGKALKTDLLKYFYPVPPVPVVPVTELNAAKEENENLKKELVGKNKEQVKKRPGNGPVREEM